MGAVCPELPAVCGLANSAHSTHPGEQLNKYLCYLKRSVKKVFKVCVKHKLQFTDGNDILKAAMDTWAQLQTIPVRGGIEELLETADENNFYDFNGGGVASASPCHARPCTLPLAPSN
eukprot:COSAG01_NODE_1340_length_10648_cov_10.144089_2_plen_118_part_00